MRIFACQQCGHRVAFEADRCLQCSSALGFLPENCTVTVVDPAEGSLMTARAGPAGERYWRCLNAAWGCNWLLPEADPGPWCASCRLTRGRPDTADTRAVAAWAATESAKRRLLFQLAELGLPVTPRSDDAPSGLAFDLVFVPGASGVTGHADGLVTIDLTESDDAHRDDVRRSLGEPYRTILGHLRHEIGHYYWPLLVPEGGPRESFRTLFGDERLDYGAAMERHYVQAGGPHHSPAHVSAYATAHPWEDWAETFAHYLHIQDAHQTATAHGLHASAPPAAVPADGEGFRAALADWVPIAEAVNAVSRSLGSADVYPFALTPAVLAKLDFVHERAQAVRTGCALGR
jgi:hypothetical protein